MTIYQAADHKRELLAALAGAAEGDTLELDLSEVDEMDTAGLQLLVLAAREAQKAGKTAVVVAHSEASQEVLDRYQMAVRFAVAPAARPE
jgi:anti-sigma B factor antagonist